MHIALVIFYTVLFIIFLTEKKLSVWLYIGNRILHWQLCISDKWKNYRGLAAVCVHLYLGFSLPLHFQCWTSQHHSHHDGPPDSVDSCSNAGWVGTVNDRVSIPGGQSYTGVASNSLTKYGHVYYPLSISLLNCIPKWNLPLARSLKFL